MSSLIKVAIIGLDTSHSVEFPKHIQSLECPAKDKVEGLQAITCMAFATPFQNAEGIAKRRATIEAWGVKVTESFDEAVKGADAILIEINDPSLHLEYFRKCAKLGKRIFLDKPMAANSVEAAEIRKLAKENNLQVMSCSSLRYLDGLEEALTKVPVVERASFFGPLGKAPAGSSIVWYGVHSFEMLEKAMGPGIAAVTAIPDPKGIVCKVEMTDGRIGIVDLVEGAYCYGGTIRKEHTAAAFSGSPSYPALLRRIVEFLKTGATDADLDVSSAVMGALDAAERSFQSGKRELVKI